MAAARLPIREGGRISRNLGMSEDVNASSRSGPASEAAADREAKQKKLMAMLVPASTLKPVAERTP